MDEKTTKADFDVRLQRGVSLPPERKFYFSSFAVTVTPADVMISLESSGQTVCLLNTPHSTAKSLVKLLEIVLSRFEKDSGYPMPTLDELQEGLARAKSK